MAIRRLETQVRANNLEEFECLKDLDLLKTMCKILINPTKVEKNKGLETTDAMVQSQHDCLVLRVCPRAWVEAQHSVQFVANRLGSEVFKRVFCDASKCGICRS